MRLVISAVNFTEGGPLTVLREAVRAAVHHHPDWTVYALVHQVGITGCAGAIEIAFPASKGSWLRRLWLEWAGFGRLARELKPDVWLSLHDITPRVKVGRQYVYCHNPAPFCTVPIAAEHHDRSFALFRRYYGLLYRCFIGRNRAVIVQQEWLRERFRHDFKVRRVIVAHPDVAPPPPRLTAPRPGPPVRFIYPAFPRVFKNIEVLGACAEILEQDPSWRGEIILTIDGSENGYAAELWQRYGHLRTLRFAGLQKPHELAALYESCDALLFPSLLETWGLPLTEAKTRGLAIVAADLPYAHETIGRHDRVDFFAPRNAAALATQLLGLHTGARHFVATRRPDPAEPFANGWQALMELLLVDDALIEACAQGDPSSVGSKASTGTR